jgi:hypothetical protein
VSRNKPADRRRCSISASTSATTNTTRRPKCSRGSSPAVGQVQDRGPAQAQIRIAPFVSTAIGSGSASEFLVGSIRTAA